MADNFPPIDLALATRDAIANVEGKPLTLRGSETVFIVEDEPRLLSVFARILTEYGYKVLQAETCTSALLICDEYPDAIDLLLADIMLAKSSGPQIAARLVSKRPEMKVLYMSGHPANSMLASAVIASGSRFIQKPIAPEALIRQIRDVLDSSYQPHLA